MSEIHCEYFRDGRHKRGNVATVVVIKIKYEILARIIERVL